jgi:hypothetical protein
MEKKVTAFSILALKKSSDNTFCPHSNTYRTLDKTSPENQLLICTVVVAVHSKPGPFDKQFCMANTAFFTSYTIFQSFNKEIFYSRQM